MIISVSKRTDIPAFYSEWFYNRVEEGFVDVVNPFNTKQVSRISLLPDDVEAFVFWTKDARPMMKDFHKLDRYDKRFYFQYTITGYHNDIEKGIKDKPGIIENFKELSRILGPKRMIFRYDPILLSNKYTIEYHCKAFEKLCKTLMGYTNKCVISFLDMYTKTARNMKGIIYSSPNNKEQNIIAKNFSEIAKKYDMRIESCAEAIDLEKYGISHSSCIDGNLLREIIFGENFKDLYEDKKQDGRKECGCMVNRDIGVYNTCMHHCLYCYANYKYDIVKENFRNYNPKKTYLGPDPHEDSKITKVEPKKVLCATEKEKSPKEIKQIKNQKLF